MRSVAQFERNSKAKMILMMIFKFEFVRSYILYSFEIAKKLRKIVLAVLNLPCCENTIIGNDFTLARIEKLASACCFLYLLYLKVNLLFEISNLLLKLLS